MQTDKLNRWFEDFRGEGDVQALGRVFDAAAPALSGLARHMSRDSSEADDLVQDTFLTAIEKAATFDGSRPLLPWLLGILTFHARESRRRRGRAVEPDRIRTGDSVDPIGEARQAELDEALAQALSSLPEIHEQVLRAHLLEGLRPEQIATELHIAPGTARVRLHRALKRLRVALPPSFATGLLALLLPNRSQAAMRREVLSYAARSSGSPLAPALVRPATGWLLATSGLLAVAVVVGALSLSRRAAEPAGAVAGSRVADVDRGTPPVSLNERDAPGFQPAADPSARARRDRASLDPGWWIVGELDVATSLQSDRSQAGEPQADEIDWTRARVFVEDLAGLGTRLELEPDEDGKFTVRVDNWAAAAGWRCDELALRVAHPDLAPAGCILALPGPPPGGVRERCELDCRLLLERPVCAIEGRVVRGTAASLGALEVAIFRPADVLAGSELKDSLTSVHVDDHGDFSVSLERAGEYIVVCSIDQSKPDWVRVDVARGQTVQVALALTDALGSSGPGGLSGRAWLAGQRSAGGAELVARPVLPPGTSKFKLNGSMLAWTGTEVQPLERRAPIAGDGFFDVPGLPAGPCQVSCSLETWLEARGIERGAQQAAAGRRELRAPAHDLELEFDLRVRTIEVRADGVALAGAHVVPLRDTWSLYRAEPTPEEWRIRETIKRRTDPRGRYALVAERLEGIEIRIDEPGHRSAELALGPDPASGDALSLEVIELLGESYSGDVEIVFEGYQQRGQEIFRVRDSTGLSRLLWMCEGSLFVESLAPGRYELIVRPLEGGDRSWFWSYLPGFTVAVEVHPGSLTRVLVDGQPGGRLRLVDVAPEEPPVSLIREDTGAFVAVDFFAVDVARGRRQMVGRPRHGRLNQTWPNLPAGDYRVVIGTGPEQIERSVKLRAGQTSVLSCASNASD